MPQAFANQIAVVTGASSGIGKAIALSLVAEGATVCLVGRDLETLQRVADKAGEHATRMFCYQADLVAKQDVPKLAEAVQTKFGHIDLLVHSAGSLVLGQIETASLVDLDHQYQCNVRAPYALTQALLPILKRRCGQIVFINSSVVLNARPNVSQYVATKQALKAIADCLREEVNASGVRVLSVFPGRTATPLQAAIHRTEGKAYRPDLLLQPEDVAAAVVAALCAPRTAEVTDIHIRPMNKTS